MSVYIRRGTTFWLPTMAGSVRERNLRGTRWLTIVIAEGDHPEHVAANRRRACRGDTVTDFETPAATFFDIAVRNAQKPERLFGNRALAGGCSAR
jgi:hypothetical protein